MKSSTLHQVILCVLWQDSCCTIRVTQQTQADNQAGTQASSRRSLLVVLTTELAVRRSNANVYNTWDAGAANRFPDKCDADPEGTKALNVTASGTLARLCASASIFLLYISTDYVFPGAPGDAPYENNAQPKPTNLYGETKLEGEKAVLAEYEKAGKAGWGAVLRVPVLYGEAEKPEESAVNTLMSSVWKAQEVKGEGSKIKMDHWAFRYPTNTEDVGRVCQGMTWSHNGPLFATN